MNPFAPFHGNADFRLVVQVGSQSIVQTLDVEARVRDADSRAVYGGVEEEGAAAAAGRMAMGSATTADDDDIDIPEPRPPLKRYRCSTSGGVAGDEGHRTTRRCFALDEAVDVAAATGVAAVTAAADDGSDGSSPASLSLSFPSSSPNPTMTPWVQPQSVPTCTPDAHQGWHEPSTACEEDWSTAAAKAFLDDLDLVIEGDDVVAGAAALAYFVKE
jgi:hypothetical protein